MTAGFRAAGRLVVLVATALVLMATSRAPVGCSADSGLLGAPVSFDVSGTCGPAAVVTLQAEPTSCAVTVTNGGAAGLGPSGTLEWDGGTRDLWLERLTPEGTQRCWGRWVDPDTWSMRCYHDVPGGCGGPDTLPDCTLSLRRVGPG